MSLTPEQTALRSRGIGASETPAIVGLDPWRRPLDIYLRKRGLVEDVESHHARRGKYLEPALRRWASDELGIEFAESGTLTHHAHPRVLATPDGIAIGGSTRAVLEIKSPGPRTSYEWSDAEDGVPDRYIVQLAQQMAVADVPVGFVAALLDGDLRVYRIERDRELEGELISACERFWREHIEADVPPEVDGSDSAREWLGRRFPRAVGEIIRADEAQADAMLALRVARERAKDAAAAEEIAEQRVKEIVGDAAGIEAPGVGKVSWRNNKDSLTTDWQAIARHLGANRAHETQFTRTRTGPRVFRFSASKERP